MTCTYAQLWAAYQVVHEVKLAKMWLGDIIFLDDFTQLNIFLRDQRERYLEGLMNLS